MPSGSLPSRECGLKFIIGHSVGTNKLSLPSRECGLKSENVGAVEFAKLVTPLAGVWIEILPG